MNVFRGLLFLLWPPGSVNSLYLRPEIERPQTPSPGLIRPSDKRRDSRRQPQSFGEHQSSHGASTRANSTNSLHAVSSVYYDLSSRTRIKIFLRICKSYVGMSHILLIIGRRGSGVVFLEWLQKLNNYWHFMRVCIV